MSRKKGKPGRGYPPRKMTRREREITGIAEANVYIMWDGVRCTLWCGSRDWRGYDKLNWSREPEIIQKLREFWEA